MPSDKMEKWYKEHGEYYNISWEGVRNHWGEDLDDYCKYFDEEKAMKGYVNEPIGQWMVSCSRYKPYLSPEEIDHLWGVAEEIIN